MKKYKLSITKYKNWSFMFWVFLLFSFNFNFEKALNPAIGEFSIAS